jgi:hypothetical protein
MEASPSRRLLGRHKYATTISPKSYRRQAIRLFSVYATYLGIKSLRVVKEGTSREFRGASQARRSVNWDRDFGEFLFGRAGIISRSENKFSSHVIAAEHFLLRSA